MIPSSSIPDPDYPELLDLLEAVAMADADRKIPACGTWLRRAFDQGLVVRHSYADLLTDEEPDDAAAYVLAVTTQGIDLLERSGRL